MNFDKFDNNMVLEKSSYNNTGRPTDNRVK